jgi:hypothetical protein
LERTRQCEDQPTRREAKTQVGGPRLCFGPSHNQAGSPRRQQHREESWQGRGSAADQRDLERRWRAGAGKDSACPKNRNGSSHVRYGSL